MKIWFAISFLGVLGCSATPRVPPGLPPPEYEQPQYEQRPDAPQGSAAPLPSAAPPPGGAKRLSAVGTMPSEAPGAAGAPGE